MLSLVKLKLYIVVHQGSVNNRKVLYNVSIYDELVAAIQICIQNWSNFEDVSHDIYQKTQQSKTRSRTLTKKISADIGSTINPFSLQRTSGVNFCRTFISSISLFLELAGSNLAQTLLNLPKPEWHWLYL